MYRMPANKVLIQRVGLNDILGDVQVGDSEGFEHTLLPNFGRVEAICHELLFTGDDVARLKSSGASLREIQEVTRRSCAYLTPIEAKVGDLVIYRRLNNVADADTIFEGGRDAALLVINHDDLIARVDGGELYALAGNVIVKDTHPESMTEVVSAGAPVIRYLEHDEVDFDDDISGKTVIANMAQAAPIGNITYAPGRTTEGLAYIKRRYILLTHEA